MTKTTPFHVYAFDGFESAHTTAAAALRAAKRGAKARKVLYTVVRCSLSGHTGAGNGTEIWASSGAPAVGWLTSARARHPRRSRAVAGVSA